MDQQSDVPPGGITILSGYTHTLLRGTDTRVGEISRNDGMTISYDIGAPAGNYAISRRGDALWFRDQIIRGQLVQFTLTTNKQLAITFSKGPANFVANVKCEGDVAEVLLIVLTYTSV